MFKRNQILIIGMILILALILFIVTNNNDIKEPLTTSPSITETLTSTEEPRYIRQLKFAYEGRMDKTKPIIGQNVEQYLDDSFDMYYFLGGLAFNNGEIVLLTNGYLEDDINPIYGEVVVIIKDVAYGIKRGISMDEVKNALGEPDEFIEFDPIYDVSELYNNNSVFIYNTGDYQVAIVFNIEDNTVIAVHLNGFKNNPGYPTTEGKINLLNLSQEELDAYNRFKSNYDEEELRGLEPISLMRLFLHATMEHDIETQWELYIKDDNYIGWDKEYHMSEFGNHKKTDFSEFENAVNIKIDYDEYNTGATIVWEDKYLEEYYDGGYPFIFGFGLVKNEDGIWKVSFLPMQ
ncbi:MAG: hypothetical protein RIN55_05925 [Tissierellaceae bacterium]|nr:hypothetical protein [Tissierellaceae bacterium]